VVAATLGAALIAGKPGAGGTALGVTLSLASLPIFLAWILVLRRAPRPATPMALPAVAIIIATLTVLPLSWMLHGPPKLDLTPTVWASILCQGVLCTLAATAAWQFGMAHVGSANAGVFMNIEPLVGSLIGVTLFGDRVTAALVAGGVLIVAGSFIVVSGDRRAPALA
jgi:drug/metabolite transporter (DMT)-like permease